VQERWCAERTLQASDVWGASPEAAIPRPGRQGIAGGERLPGASAQSGSAEIVGEWPFCFRRVATIAVGWRDPGARVHSVAWFLLSTHQQANAMRWIIDSVSIARAIGM